VPAFPPHGVFVNYRREDAGPYARLLQFKLGERFPGVPVFMDLDSIEAGADFAEAIKSGVDSCAVLIALIGPKWLAITDEDGRRRLDDPDDYVRYEIRTALERGVRVIPVLVDGARTPRQQQLPDDLQRLARLNALEMSYDRLDYDATRLMDVIQKVLAAGASGLSA
jgi:TIR domain